jgi:hypothetical protein
VERLRAAAISCGAIGSSVDQLPADFMSEAGRRHMQGGIAGVQIVFDLFEEIRLRKLPARARDGLRPREIRRSGDEARGFFPVARHDRPHQCHKALVGRICARPPGPVHIAVAHGSQLSSEVKGIFEPADATPTRVG